MKKSAIHGSEKEALLLHISDMLDTPGMELIIIEKTREPGYRNTSFDAYRVTYTGRE